MNGKAPIHTISGPCLCVNVQQVLEYNSILDVGISMASMPALGLGAGPIPKLVLGPGGQAELKKHSHFSTPRSSGRN